MSRKIDETEELKLRFQETKRRLVENLRHLGQDLEGDFANTVDKAASRIELGVERVSSNVAGAISHTVDSFHSGIDDTVGKLKERLDVRAAVRMNPWRNLGISFATGLGAALLFSRRRRAVALPAPQALAPAPTPSVGIIAGFVVPALVELARAGAGQMLENLVETSLRRAHEGLEAHSPRYAKAAEAVRHRAAGDRDDLH